MTIAEHLQQQVRLCHRIKWGTIFVMLFVAIQQVALNHSKVDTYAWMLVVAAPCVAALVVVTKRLKCPRCQKPLYMELAHSMPTMFGMFGLAKRELGGKQPLALDACPRCGCSFSEPHFAG